MRSEKGILIYKYVYRFFVRVETVDGERSVKIIKGTQRKGLRSKGLSKKASHNQECGYCHVLAEIVESE